MEWNGIVGMQGDGPLNGTPKHTGVVIMGSDLLAVDATCCRLMKLDPEKVAYLVMGNRKKLGALAEGQIQQLGETIAGRAQALAGVNDIFSGSYYCWYSAVSRAWRTTPEGEEMNIYIDLIPDTVYETRRHGLEELAAGCKDLFK